jgi:hypothetical protein
MANELIPHDGQVLICFCGRIWRVEHRVPNFQKCGRVHCRWHGISAATFYGWKQKFGGMDISEAQRLKAFGGREPAVEATGGGAESALGSAEGRDPKKRLELAGLRDDVAFAQAEHGLSECTACKLPGTERSSYRSEPRPDRHAELRIELVQLAR